MCVCNYIPERKAEPVKLMLAFENANIYIIHIEVTKLSFSKLGHFDNLVLLVDPNVSIIHRFTYVILLCTYALSVSILTGNAYATVRYCIKLTTNLDITR